MSGPESLLGAHGASPVAVLIYKIGHDVVWVLSDRGSDENDAVADENTDSAIFLFGPSSHTFRILFLKQPSTFVCGSGWQAIM